MLQPRHKPLKQWKGKRKNGIVRVLFNILTNNILYLQIKKTIKKMTLYCFFFVILHPKNLLIRVSVRKYNRN